jgi:hypothetical protein
MLQGVEKQPAARLTRLERVASLALRNKWVSCVDGRWKCGGFPHMWKFGVKQG